MIESIATHYTRKQMPKPDAESVQPAAGPKSKQHSIVPRSSVAGTALVLVIAIMTFLASLTLGAVTLVNDTAYSWQSDISREVTIQLRPVEGQDLDTSLIRLRQIAGGTPGIVGVKVLSQDAMGRLLEPWLGSGLNLDDLPVPQLILLKTSENAPPDLLGLREKIEAAVAGASLDDHRAWTNRLGTMARATVLLGLGVFSLMMAATILTVVFATRGAMSGNAHVIEVLHFVGAEQSYIAKQFQRHFLILGLKGASVGGVLAIVTFFVVGFWIDRNVADPVADQAAVLFGTFSMGPGGYIGTLILIFLVALLTALTSRFTVLRHVGTLDRSQPNNPGG